MTWRFTTALSGSFAVLLGVACLLGGPFGAAVSPSAHAASPQATVAEVYSPETDEEMLAYGAYLYGECAICHTPSKAHRSDIGIPDISGISVTEFYKAMTAYRSGERDNNTMVSAATALDIEQIMALAAYVEHLQSNGAQASSTP